MEGKTKYEDIDPIFEWKKDEDEGHDILELHVQGFNKEQLKVQLNSRGSIVVNGERPPNELMKLNGCCFRKELKLSKQHNSTAAGITANLSHGILRIKLPKSETVTDETRSRSDPNSTNCVDRSRRRTMLLSAAVIVTGFGAYLWLSYKYSVSLSQDHHSMKNQTGLELFPLPI